MIRNPISSPAPLSILAITAALLVAGMGAAEPVDVQQLRECARSAWNEDIAEWSGYAFDRHVTRRRLDKEGGTTFREQKRFRITPTADGFDERLLRIDGREATPKEVKKFREEAWFTRRHQGAETLQLDNPIGESLALMPVLQAQELKPVGETEINGFPCHRFVFDPGPAPEEGDVYEQLKYAITGSACFTVDGCHLVAFEMESVRPVKDGAVTMEHLQLSFEGQPVENDGWLLGEVELHSNIKILFKSLRTYNSYRYSNFIYQPK